MAAGLNVRTHQPTTRGQLTMVIVPLVFLILATISFGLRVYARRLKRLRLFVDDYLALLALAVAYGGYASALVMVLGGGVGLDIYTLDHSTLVIFIKVSERLLCIFASNRVLESWRKLCAMAYSHSSCTTFSSVFLYSRIWRPPTVSVHLLRDYGPSCRMVDIWIHQRTDCVHPTLCNLDTWRESSLYQR
jgi:hypothetical protein